MTFTIHTNFLRVKDDIVSLIYIYLTSDMKVFVESSLYISQKNTIILICLCVDYCNTLTYSLIGPREVKEIYDYLKGLESQLKFCQCLYNIRINNSL